MPRKRMSKERLNEIIERYDAATPGLWKAEHYRCGSIHRGFSWSKIVGPDGEKLFSTSNEDKNHENNAEFAAHARQDIPDLVEEVTWLRVEFEQSIRCDEVNRQLVIAFRNELDERKRRAEALEKAVKIFGSCRACIYNKGIHCGFERGGCEYIKEDNWQFDEARFASKEETN